MEDIVKLNEFTHYYEDGEVLIGIPSDEAYDRYIEEYHRRVIEGGETAYYQFNNGMLLSQGMLDSLEICGITEDEIGNIYGITRYHLYKLRLMYFVKRKKRAPKKSMPEWRRKERFNEYMRGYRERNPEKFKYENIRVGRQAFKKARHLMAFKLGRPLTSKEVVHHIDGNPRNNNLDNLMLFASQGQHLEFHRNNT